MHGAGNCPPHIVIPRFRAERKAPEVPPGAFRPIRTVFDYI